MRSILIATAKQDTAAPIYTPKGVLVDNEPSPPPQQTTKASKSKKSSKSSTNISSPSSPSSPGYSNGFKSKNNNNSNNNSDSNNTEAPSYPPRNRLYFNLHPQSTPKDQDFRCAGCGNPFSGGLFSAMRYLSLLFSFLLSLSLLPLTVLKKSDIVSIAVNTIVETVIKRIPLLFLLVYFMNGY